MDRSDEYRRRPLPDEDQERRPEDAFERGRQADYSRDHDGLKTARSMQGIPDEPEETGNSTIQPLGGYQAMSSEAALKQDPAGKQPIGKDQVREARKILKKYKDGKSHLEDKIAKNEKWWRIRHWDMMTDESTRFDPKPASAWLFNVIISKHADFMDSFPSINILPREQNDIQEAKKLSSIVPVVMEQNDYESVYSDEIWYKLKHGTGVYMVSWDSSKLNGLGDISIKSMDLLSLFWEPGVTDIQKSQHFFSVELCDNDLLIEQYPQLKGVLKPDNETTLKQYYYDDNINTNGKSAVIDWYYHKRGKLHFCKFVEEEVLYATENDPEYAGRGWYDHGKYPFVFDTLFPEAGMPVGFGFVDVCKNPQISIDVMNNSFEKNAMFLTNPRYFIRNDGGINEEEFADPNRLIIHSDINLGDDSIKAVTPPSMFNSNYIAVLQNKIDEMKETAGNRDAANGGTTSGVTAASAIAAMQESAGKTSRDQIKTTYRAHEQVVTMVIELIRQFYSLPRQFRITGENGDPEYVTYDNSGLQPEPLGTEFGVDFGERLPVFDIKVSAEKESPYSQLSQNELALQFFGNGFFNPQMCDQALACVEMMTFEGKQQVVDKISQNGGMYQQMLQMQQQMLQMAETIDQLNIERGQPTNLAEQLAAGINGAPQPGTPEQVNTQALHDDDQTQGRKQGENRIVSNARARAATASRPR